ncbi:hypothetical protein R5R35_001691 [Gryllus longicercus]|uniref:C2H2-type domain-containing protein n=2 Tax=Gryllus longicercus TaxID=2509291 RepID=A0AAN9Z826_9ORTH
MYYKDDMANKSVKCLVCNEMFTKRSNMYAHMRNVHKLKDEKDPVPRKIRKKTELCMGCGKAFTTKHNLQRHMQKMHDGVANFAHSTRIKCPESGCDESFPTYCHLREHLTEHHEKELFVDEIRFSSEEDFFRWKEEMQIKTVSLFVADTSKKTMKDGTQKLYYNCHRSYTYRGSGQNKRRLKSAGSIKIGTTCPARLEVTIKDGMMQVKFWKTHIGHSMDLEHIHLSKAARTEIADRMKLGHSFQQILYDIHNGKLQNIDSRRGQLVKRKDLHNIFRDFHIGSFPKQVVDEAKNTEILSEDLQQLENVRNSGSFEEIFDVMQNKTVDNIENPNEPPEHSFHHCTDISAASLKQHISTPVLEEIHPFTADGPLLYFEEQHSHVPTVLELTGKNQEYSVTYYEVGAEDCAVSDQDITNERDQNGFPVVFVENEIQENNDITNKTEEVIAKSSPAKSSDIGCPDCGQMFTKRKNLYAHMRNIHKLVGASDPVSPQKRCKTEVCSLCGKAFTNKNSLRRHRQKIHKEGVANSHTPRIRCPELHCVEAFSSYGHLREHLLILHQRELVMEEMQFRTEKDFQLWKDSIQANNVSFYVLDTSKKIMKDGTEKKYYNCHRSHSYKCTGKNIRKLKRAGSSKIGRTCPSRLEVVVKDGHLDVKFWTTHVGHSMDVGHTTLSKAVRTEIAEMLNQGASFEHVLDLARNGKLQANQSQRTPLIKRKDLHNICRDFHISSSCLQSADKMTDVNWCVQDFPR